MSIKLKKNIITTIKILLIIAFILSIPNLIQVIWDSGKDFGSNVMKAILSLM